MSRVESIRRFLSPLLKGDVVGRRQGDSRINSLSSLRASWRRNKQLFYMGKVSDNMPCVAEFGIIDEFEKDKDYSCYEPEKYNCVAIDDDILNDWWNELTLIKTYFHCYSRPSFALARWGVTLIPPESLEAFYNIVSTDKRSKSSKELIDLMVLLRKAISKNKYVIHYGV